MRKGCMKQTSRHEKRVHEDRYQARRDEGDIKDTRCEKPSEQGITEWEEDTRGGYQA
jgi:hypothetical protein